MLLITTVCVCLFLCYANSKICKTPGCQDAASMLIKSMDQTVQPCNNFYQFACGNFIKNHSPARSEQSSHKILETQILSSLGQSLGQISYTNATFPMSVRTAASVYQACLNSSTPPLGKPIINLIASLTDGISKIGGWPMVTPNWRYKGFNLEGLIAQLQAHHGTSVMLHSDVDSDWGKPGQYAVYLTQANLILGSKTQYESALFAGNRQNYVNTIIKVAQLLRADMGLTAANISDAQITRDAQAVLQYETAMARKKIVTTEQRNYQFYYNPMSFVQLNNRWPMINWTIYYSNLLSLHNPNYLQKLQQRIIVNAPGFIDRLHDDIGGNPRTVINYVIYRLILSNMEFLPVNSPYYQVWAEFQTSLVGGLPPTPGKCAQKLVRLMPFATGNLYLTNNLNSMGRSQQDVRSMMANLQAAFINILNNAAWLDGPSRYNAQQKSNMLLQYIGFPAWVLNGEQLDQYYGDFINSINPKLGYFYMVQALKFVAAKIQFQKLGQPINRLRPFPPIDYSLLSPASTRVRYWASLNSLMIPAAVMNPPYYRYDFPRSINYGALGQFAASHWMNGFSYIGSQFTGNGTLVPSWMSQSSQNAFNGALQCLTSQYSKYCYGPQANYMCVDGLKTRTSNINELTGLLTAYEAYKIYQGLNGPEQPLIGLTQFTSNQLFFIAYANSRCHSYSNAQIMQIISEGTAERAGPPTDAAILGTLENLDVFGQAFGCSRGSVMWPQVSQQCHIYNQPPPVPSPGPQTSSTMYPALSVPFVRSGKTIAAAISKQANPCQDFYQYACGGFMSANPAQNGAYGASTGYNLEKQILNQIVINLNNVNMSDTKQSKTMQTMKIFLQSCNSALLNQSGNINALLASLDGYATNGWPIITPNWSAPQNGYNMWSNIGYLESFYLIPTVMFSFTTQDWKNTAKNALFIDPGRLALGSRAYYINPTFQASLAAYQKLIVTAAKQVANDASHLVPLSSLQADAQAIVNFEVQLAQIQISRNQYMNNPQSQYNEYTMAQLINRWPLIDWKKYISPLLAIHILQLPGDHYIITEPAYFDQLQGLIQNTPQRTLINYFGWRLIYQNMAFLHAPMRKMLYEFQAKAKDVNFNLPLPGFECAMQLVSYMKFGAARAFIGTTPGTFYDKMRTQAGFTVQKLVAGLVQAIQSGNVLDSASKYQSTIKFNGVVSDIGYPRWILNNTLLDKYHRGYIFSITSNDGGAFWHNLQFLKKNALTNYLMQLLQPANRLSWDISPAWDFVSYNYPKNSILAGLGSLFPPQFGVGYPQAINFGIFGTKIGVELGKGLNNRGSQFSRNGSLATWLSSASKLNLQTAGLCLQNQYNKYCYPQVGNTCVNGQNTMSQNMADLIGVEAAFNGYHSSMAFYGQDPPIPGIEQYSADQLFFLGYAYGMCHTHTNAQLMNYLVRGEKAPPRDRVNGVLQNMPAFAKAFSCNVGVDPMAPSGQCKFP